MISPKKEISLSTAALVAGLAILLMGTTPLAEALVYNKLVVPTNAVQTVKNITVSYHLFGWGIIAYLINFICDIVAAWALYNLLKPANAPFSMLTAWFRIIYTLVALAALLNLVTVSRLLGDSDYFKAFDKTQVNTQVMLSLSAFRNNWSFGMIFFGMHLCMLGYLAYISGYIPRIVGLLLVVAGLGYLADNLQPFLFPGVDLPYIAITFFGELVFMFWLLIKGSGLKYVPGSN